MSSRIGVIGFLGFGLLTFFTGCHSSPTPDRNTLAPKIVLRPGQPSESSTSEDCGLANYPASRSTQEILADVSRDEKKPPNSDMLAKVAIDKNGRITHIRILRLGYQNAPNWRKINEDALESVKRWSYKPTLYEGKPVVVCADVGVTIDFR